MITLDPQRISIDAASSGVPSRTITGLAAPYNKVAYVQGGQAVKFLPGSIPTDGPAPKLIQNHNMAEAIGLVTERVDSAEGLLFSAKISSTRNGNDALQLALDGVYDSVSVGIEPIDFYYDDNNVMVIKSSAFVELSLVPVGAFEDAKITKVAAEKPNETKPQEKEINKMETVNATAELKETPATVETKFYAQAAKPIGPMPTAAQYIAAAIAGGSAFHEMRQAIQAAAPSAPYVDTESNPGTLPEVIVQSVYNNFVGMRPVVDAIGVRAMPSAGQFFIRPSVSTNVSMAIQSAQNAALQAGTLQIARNTVEKKSYGGYVVISEQDLDWTTPEILNVILDDMGRIYANTTDNVAADALVSGTTQTGGFPDPTDPEQWAGWIAQGAAAILSGSNGNLPTHLFLSPNQWQNLLALVDGQGRPLFPQVGPMNAYGNVTPVNSAGVAFGLNVVVDRNFPSNTIIIGAAGTSNGNPTGGGFEIFEQQKGAISIDVPSTLSRTVAFRGYFATLMIDDTKFYKATGL